MTLRHLTRHLKVLSFRWGVWLLLPSFINTWLYSDRLTPSPPSSASALQGLRGVAAVIVFHTHLLRSFSSFVDYGYGVDKISDLGLANLWFHQLPFLRLAYSGGAMVEIFFLVSGYTQSLQALRLIEKSKAGSSHRRLASAILSRIIRLVVPTFVAGVMVTIAVWLGLYEWGSSYRNTWFEGPGVGLPKESSLFMALWAMCRSFYGLLRIWDWEEYIPAFNPYMWTIGVELRCSIALQLTLAGVGLVHRSVRVPITMGLMVCSHLYGRWEFVCYLSGLLLANICLIREVNVPVIGKNILSLPQTNSPRTVSPRREHLNVRILYTVIFLIGLYLLSFPKEDGHLTPGYRILSSFTPSNWKLYRFWNNWGAFLVIFSLTNDRFLAHPFHHPILQYLGTISYAIYLVHRLVLHAVAYVFIPLMWLAMGKESIFSCVVSFELATCVVVVPSLIWVADIFHRAIDVPCGSLCFRIKRWVFSISKHDGDWKQVVT
jgi:peptidoglycan/LPS O-acetylase OafA/YrhL